MKKYQLHHLILFIAGYGVFSLFMFFLTFDGLSIWMAINVGFAMIPLIVITYLNKRFVDSNLRIDIILIFGILFFVFFYPNAFYIITDFMHLDKLDFYTTQQYVGTSYRLIIDPYFMLIHITISAFLGVFAGIQSLLLLEEMVLLKFGKKWINRTLVILMMFLSSVGIYIGRFLRFFSWDMLNPFKVIKELYNSFELFTVEFILLFTITHLVVYYGYKFVMMSELKDNHSNTF